MSKLHNLNNSFLYCETGLMLSCSFDTEQQKRARNIIIELMQTERTYIRVLKYCLDTFYKEFTNNVDELPDYLKGKESAIFANLEEIHAFHDKSVYAFKRFLMMTL